MALTRVDGPDVLAVSEAAAWDHLRLILADGSPVEPADRDHVRRLLEAAIGEAEDTIGRRLITQTWLLTLDRFPQRSIMLPLPPTISVSSIAYVDPDGATVTLPSNAYQTSGLGSEDRAEISPAFNTSWPMTRAIPEAVSVNFLAGYGDAPENVPPVIAAAILEIVATRYGWRQSVAPGQAIPMPLSAVDALASYRVWTF